MANGRYARRLRGIPRSWRELERSLQLLGSLRNEGWQRSINSDLPVDATGAPIAWLTISALKWLAVRMEGVNRVFEYGCGASTLWFSNWAAEVVAVEHDDAWADRIRARAGANVRIIHCPVAEKVGDVGRPTAYAEVVIQEDKLFDVILIDGMDRNGCARLAAEKLDEEGIIVFDNSHRAIYRQGIDYLMAKGCWRIDFFGFPSGFGTLGWTSVFGRGHRWLTATPSIPDSGW